MMSRLLLLLQRRRSTEIPVVPSHVCVWWECIGFTAAVMSSSLLQLKGESLEGP